MVHRNARKEEILAYLRQQEGRCTANQLAGAIGISLKNASELLRRYHKFGYIRKKRIRLEGGPPKAFLYTIRPEGEAKLKWLESRTIQGKLLPDKEWKGLIKGKLLD